jgi:dTDP-4-amino-4,6-dideoxygalactose transaminase
VNIPFNKAFIAGKETDYIREAIHAGKISGDGVFTKKCHRFFEERYGFSKALLTTSCTDALEMSAILLNIKEGDEVIAPSYTFVSTVNPFVLRGAKIIFADSNSSNPNIDADAIESLIGPRTKAIIPVHYAGIACDMDKIMALAHKHKLAVVEDAAQAVDSFHKGIPLGSIGSLSAFSFHETKSISSGEGGLLAINDKQYVSRAEIIWEKGTNRASFFRGEVDKYGWVDIGSSFLPSEIIAAFLLAQLESLEEIQTKRKGLWKHYQEMLSPLAEQGHFQLPFIPAYASNNAHMFYLVLNSLEERTALMNHLRSKNIHTVFHYLSLHKSPYYTSRYKGKELPNADRYTDCLLRLPMFCDLKTEEVDKVCEQIQKFFSDRK